MAKDVEAAGEEFIGVKVRFFEPVLGRIEGRAVRVFPVPCVSCGRLFLSFPMDRNRQKRADYWENHASYVPDPEKMAPKIHLDDVGLSVGDFCALVGKEKNQMVRGAIVSRFKARGFFFPWPWAPANEKG